MLSDLLYNTFSALLCGTMDFVFFMLVDAVAKTPLREARSVEEKRRIWLYEGAALLLMSGLIYALHHVPYLLLTLASVTLLYTQVHGRVDFRYWWTQLATKWDEFQQHEESMEEHRERTRLYGNQTGYPSVAIPYMPTTQARPPGTFVYQRGSILPKFDRQPRLLQPEVMPPNVNVTPAGFFEQRQSGNNRQISQPPKNAVTKNSLNQQPNSVDPLNKLKPKLKTAPVLRHISDTANMFKSKVMSAIGYNALNMPSGIRNQGSTCFANSVLQCLARSNALAEKLVLGVTEMKCSDPYLTNLATACTELLFSLNMAPETVKRSVIDIDSFCDAAADAKCALFLHESTQQQQDAAEFLMWMLDALNRALKIEKRGTKRKFDSPALEMLRFIYGDLNSRRVEDLKQACRREIDLANGLQNNTYAEPIQRLSDLEWLTYKQENSTVVDDLFTGQLVETQHCVECNRVSVSIQTFSILPVPIVSIVDKTGTVSLDDCLAKFAIIEKLYGAEGLKCPNCNSAKSAGEHIVSSTPAVFRNRYTDDERVNNNANAGFSDSGLPPPGQSLLMSPIQASGTPSDSGFHDPQFKTSTPLLHDQQTGNLLSPGKRRMTDGQRRSLLRQLPPCLVIQLMRFRFNPFNGLPHKVRTPVTFPYKGLDMHSLIYDNVAEREDLTSIDTKQSYDLYGLCIHLGAESTNRGHYISYCKAVDGKWYRFDDDRVECVDIVSEIRTPTVQENVYMLFYRQTNPVPAAV